MAKFKIHSKFRDLVADKLMDLGNYIFIALVIGQALNLANFSMTALIIGVIFSLACYYAVTNLFI